MGSLQLAPIVLKQYPSLKKDLRLANVRMHPVRFISNSLRKGIMLGSSFTLLLFFFLSKQGLPLFFLLPAFLVFCYGFFMLEMVQLKAKVSKRRKQLDNEAMFIGRYLLIKLHAGRPLLNALTETSQSKGIAAQFVREIVHNIDTGTPIEEALKEANEFCPSMKFSKILFQINNALKLGINVTRSLESVLQELSKEEHTAIKAYGKKLNSLVIFYMIVAIIAPSLGISMFMVFANFINLSIGMTELSVVVFFLFILQFIFITMFRSIRPAVNL